MLAFLMHSSIGQRSLEEFWPPAVIYKRDTSTSTNFTCIITSFDNVPCDLADAGTDFVHRKIQAKANARQRFVLHVPMPLLSKVYNIINNFP